MRKWLCAAGTGRQCAPAALIWLHRPAAQLHLRRMPPIATLGLFVTTAVAEILGCYLPYLW